MCCSHSSTVGHQEGTSSARAQPGSSERGTRGICRGRAGLGFLSCLPSPMWGLPLSFGFLHHWINVCSTWRPKSSAEAKMWAWGIPGGTGLAVAAGTLQAALCSHKKRSSKKSSENNTLNYKLREITEDRAELQLCLHLLPGFAHSITTTGEAIFVPKSPLAEAKALQHSPKTPRAA